MNYVEISDLLSKGFTPDQIVMLAGANPPEPQGEPSPEPEHSPEPKPDGKQDPAPEPEHSPKPEPDGKQDPAPEPEPSPEMKALRDEMKALKEAIQAQNIIKQHFDNVPPSDNTESILAGIIRPPFEEKKN